MSFTKATMKSFRSDFAHAVADLERQYDVQLNLGNIRFDATSFRTKLEAVSKKVASVPTPMIMNASNGPKIGDKFRLPGKPMIYTVSSWLPKAKKYSIGITSINGASYKISLATFLAAERI